MRNRLIEEELLQLRIAFQSGFPVSGYPELDYQNYTTNLAALKKGLYAMIHRSRWDEVLLEKSKILFEFGVLLALGDQSRENSLQKLVYDTIECSLFFKQEEFKKFLRNHEVVKGELDSASSSRLSDLNEQLHGDSKSGSPHSFTPGSPN